MIKYRIALAGKASGLREIIESIIEDQSDMSLVDIISGDASCDSRNIPLYQQLKQAIKNKHVNVVIMDYEKSVETINSYVNESQRNEKIKSMVDVLLEQHPNITMICLSSLGKRMNIHSEIKLDGVGVYQLMNAIRTLGKDGNNIIYQ